MRIFIYDKTDDYRLLMEEICRKYDVGYEGLKHVFVESERPNRTNDTPTALDNQHHLQIPSDPLAVLLHTNNPEASRLFAAIDHIAVPIILYSGDPEGWQGEWVKATVQQPKRWFVRRHALPIRFPSVLVTWVRSKFSPETFPWWLLAGPPAPLNRLLAVLRIVDGCAALLQKSSLDNSQTESALAACQGEVQLPDWVECKELETKKVDAVSTTERLLWSRLQDSLYTSNCERGDLMKFTFAVRDGKVSADEWPLERLRTVRRSYTELRKELSCA